MKEIKFDMTQPRKLHCWKRPHKDVYTLYIYRNEVEYDVKYELWQMSRTQELQEQNLDIFELAPSDGPWLERNIQTALANFRQAVAWATRSHNLQASNEVSEPLQCYEVPLSLDSEWAGSIEHVCNCLHNYTVSFCLSEWLSGHGLEQSASVVKAEASTWLRKAHHEIDSYNNIRSEFHL